jgi:hypothetical protein
MNPTRNALVRATARSMAGLMVSKCVISALVFSIYTSADLARTRDAGIWQTMNRCCPCRRRGQASGRSLTSPYSTYAAARHREVLKWQLSEMSRKVFCSCNTALNNFALGSVIHYGYSDCDKLFGSDLGANCHRTLTATSAVNRAKFCVSNFHSAVFTSILAAQRNAAFGSFVPSRSVAFSCYVAHPT